LNGEKEMRNFHLPLLEHIYAQLRAEAERRKVPATTLVPLMVSHRQESRLELFS